jgi:hypothetical protein
VTSKAHAELDGEVTEDWRGDDMNLLRCLTEEGIEGLRRAFEAVRY